MSYFEIPNLTEEQKAQVIADAHLKSHQLESYDNPPTRLEMAVGLFTRTATSDASGNVHARSVRIPSIENLTIEALAKYSGLSVNKVIVQLLEVALDEVFSAFTEQQRAELFAIRGKMMKDLIPADATYPAFPELGGEPSTQGEI